MGIKKTSLRGILKEDLKMKPYRLHRSQELTEDHKKQRYDFCRWMINDGIDLNKIIFTDENGLAWVDRQTDKTPKFGQPASHSPTKKAIAKQDIRSRVRLELLMAIFFPFFGSRKKMDLQPLSTGKAI